LDGAFLGPIDGGGILPVFHGADIDHDDNIIIADNNIQTDPVADIVEEPAAIEDRVAVPVPVADTLPIADALPTDLPPDDDLPVAPVVLPQRPHAFHNPPQPRVLHISVKAALREYPVPAMHAITSELKQMLSKKVWTPVDSRKLTVDQRRSIIRSSMFIKEKFDANGVFEKLKARLVAGGDQQEKSLYADISSSTVAHACRD
jgi:acyl-CoA synthetase (AMP-forming)/AMP-acid ligase II